MDTGFSRVAVISWIVFLLVAVLLPVLFAPEDVGAAPGMDIGDCTGMATSDQITPSTLDPTASTGVYVAELEGEAEYEGSIAVPVPTPRDGISGEIVLATPPLMPSIPVGGSWGPEGSETSDAGTQTWDIPEWAPRGVVFKVSGSHSEQGVDCSGFVLLTLEGGAFDSLLVFGPLLLAIVLAVVLVMLMRSGRPVLAAIVGLLMGLSLGVLEVLLGLQRLDGPAPVVLAIAGLALGVIAALDHGRPGVETA